MRLSSSSLSHSASRIQGMVTITRQDVQLANEISTMRDETATNIALTRDKAAELGGLQDQITQSRAALAVQKTRYDQLIKEAQGQITSQGDVRDQQAALRNQQLNQAADQNQH